MLINKKKYFQTIGKFSILKKRHHSLVDTTGETVDPEGHAPLKRIEFKKVMVEPKTFRKFKSPNFRS